MRAFGIGKVFLITIFCAGCAALLATPRFYLPAEDAIILHIYSSHLAHQGTITFFTGGPRAEGATDFLWMVLLAGAIKTHLSAFVTTQVINVLSLLAIGYGLLRLSGTRITIARVLASAALPFFWPQIVAAIAGFAVLPFAALILALAVLMYQGRDVAAACVLLMLCLFRPDGIVFAVPLLGYRMGWAVCDERRRLPYRVWLPYLLLFVVPGSIYFFWRWHYFGELFPLPFLVKSDTRRHLLLFVKSSIDSMLPYLGALAVALMLAWKALIRYPRRLTLVAALTLLPTLFYAAMRLDQNNADRFFVYLPLATLAALSLAWREQAWHRHRSILIVAVAWVVLLAQRMDGSVSDFLGFNQTARGFEQLAVAIHDTLPRGRMIVTEAGLTPYYTDWEAYDAWGLNTREFAERLITADDVRALHADVVMLHQMREPPLPCTARTGATGVEKVRSQDNMTDNMIRGIPPGYDAWFLPYPQARAQASAQQITQATPHQCWFVNPTYTGKAGLEEILQVHGAVRLSAIAR